MKKVGYRYWLRLILISFISISLQPHGLAQPWPDDPWGNDNGSGAGTDAEGFTEDDPPEDPGGGGHGDPDLPIDSNILILVGGVVAYGLKKWWDVKYNYKRKNSLQSTANYEEFIK